MPTFEYMRVRQSFRGCEANGPGSEKFADMHNLDALLAALGAEGWELVTALTESDAKMYLLKRQGGSPSHPAA